MSGRQHSPLCTMDALWQHHLRRAHAKTHLTALAFEDRAAAWQCRQPCISDCWQVLDATDADQPLRSIEVEPSPGDAPCQPQAAMRYALSTFATNKTFRVGVAAPADDSERLTTDTTGR